MQSKAKTVSSYLESLPKDRKPIINFFHEFIRKTLPKLKPHMAYGMIGYGKFKYKNYKNEIIDWPVVALANQKNYVSVYVCALKGGEYVAEKYSRDLGKVSVGRSCIRFKKINDVNLPTLRKVLEIAEKNPGLVGAGKYRKKN